MGSIYFKVNTVSEPDIRNKQTKNNINNVQAGLCFFFKGYRLGDSDLVVIILVLGTFLT